MISMNWGSQSSHILDGLRALSNDKNDLLLTDVTLACDGEYIPAHKLVLSLCSPFFKDLFQKNRADYNTIVIVSHVSAGNLRHLLNFMYQGRVDIPSTEAQSFLLAGKLLKVEGLSGNSLKEAHSPAPAPVSKLSSNPAPASRKVVVTPLNDSASLSKKPRLTIESGGASMNSEESKTAEEIDGDPLALAGQFEDDIDEEFEARLDVRNLKEEPIHIYSGFEDEWEDDADEPGEDGNEMPTSYYSSEAGTGHYTSSRTATSEMRKNRSPIWNHFKLLGDQVECRYCKKTFTRSSSRSTGAFWTHLKKAHPNHSSSD